MVESYTLQVLPPELREEAIGKIAIFIAPGGTLLVIIRGRKAREPDMEMAWPLAKAELLLFLAHDLGETSFEDFMDKEDPPVRRFRVAYCR